MASNRQARELTERHRRSQLAIKAAVTAAALSLWSLLDPDDLDATTPVWVAATERLIRVEQDKSQRAARAYFQSFAAAETGRLYDQPPTATVDLDRVRGNLTIAGPVTAKALIGKGQPAAKALSTARVHAAGETARLTLEPHRRMLADSLNADFGDNPPPRGWARVTSGSPCAFCAMLASRGPVYRSERTGGFQSHGHCACTVEPVFKRDAPWPGQAREFQRQWNQAQQQARDDGELRRGTSNDALNAFRRARDG